jgi:hypothetical protein
MSTIVLSLLIVVIAAVFYYGFTQLTKIEN